MRDREGAGVCLSVQMADKQKGRGGVDIAVVDAANAETCRHTFSKDL